MLWAQRAAPQSKRRAKVAFGLAQQTQLEIRRSYLQTPRAVQLRLLPVFWALIQLAGGLVQPLDYGHILPARVLFGRGLAQHVLRQKPVDGPGLLFRDLGPLARTRLFLFSGH